MIMLFVLAFFTFVVPGTTVYARTEPPQQQHVAVVKHAAVINTVATTTTVAATKAATNVPFYSQFRDIASPKWQKVGCGITSLTMLIDFYKPNAVSVESLLAQGIAAGAYDQNAGWIYKGLIQLAGRYGLSGTYYDLSKLSTETAFTRFKGYLKDGPVMLAVHYKFDPKSTIPHLVVINRIDKDIIYYNDPAAKVGEKQISVADFLKGWKKKVITFRPVKDNKAIALVTK